MKLDRGSIRSSSKNGIGPILRKNWGNGATRVIEDVLLDPDGLPHVLALAVPLLILFAGWVEGII